VFALSTEAIEIQQQNDVTGKGHDRESKMQIWEGMVMQHCSVLTSDGAEER
jgi:hypothetical protein